MAQRVQDGEGRIRCGHAGGGGGTKQQDWNDGESGCDLLLAASLERTGYLQLS